MRTTLALDDDIFAYARERAQRERISIGQAVSKLVRDGIRSPTARLDQQMLVTSKYALLPLRAEVITTEHVRNLMDQEGF